MADVLQKYEDFRYEMQYLLVVHDYFRRSNLYQIHTHSFYVEDAYWTDWGTWTSCSVSCGGGNQTRDRACKWPSSVHGNSCAGDVIDTQPCNIELCAGEFYSRNLCNKASH